MIIKKIRIEKVEDAEKIIGKEFGPDAIILTTRPIKEKGLRALFSTEQIEVTVAIDEEDWKKYKDSLNRKDLFSTEGKRKGSSSSDSLESSLADLKKVLGKISEDSDKKKDKGGSSAYPILSDRSEAAKVSKTYKDSSFDDHSWKTKANIEKDQVSISEDALIAKRKNHKKEQSLSKTSKPALKQGVEPYLGAGEFSRIRKNLSSHFLQEPRKAIKEEKSAYSKNPLEISELRKIIREEFLRAQKSVSLGDPFSKNLEEDIGSVRFLISKGIDRSLALRIERKLVESFGEIDLSKAGSKRTRYLNGLRDELSGMLKTTGPIDFHRGESTIMALVGPTGVGKTSTLMKIAAEHSIGLKKKVAFISLAKEKPLGFEEVYEFFLGLGGEGIFISEDIFQLQGAIDKFSDKDLILIDTEGFSQLSRKQIENLAEIFSFIDHLEVCLAMSVMTRELDVYGIIQQFSALKINSIIFTKIDETLSLGGMLNVCEKFKMPIRYLTLGKRMYNDLKMADAVDISRRILIQKEVNGFQERRKYASA